MTYLLDSYRNAAAATDSSFSSVVFLAGFEGSNGATTYSEEKNSRAGTFSGSGAQISNTQSKFGSTSLYTGTTGYVTFADNADWDFGSGAFTVEFFMRMTADVAGFGFIVGQWNTAANQKAWAVQWDGGSDLLRFVDSVTGSATDNLLSYNGGVAAANLVNQWRHICVDKSGLDHRLYVDGVMASKSSVSRTFFNSTAALAIGAQADGSNPMPTTYIDELRITKGVARYASDSGFTVPTSAYPRS